MYFHASSGFPTAFNLYSLPFIAGSLIPHGVGSLIPNARCNLVRSISSSITKGGSKLGLDLVMMEGPCADHPGYFALRLQGLSPACWQKKCNPRNARTKGYGLTGRSITRSRGVCSSSGSWHGVAGEIRMASPFLRVVSPLCVLHFAIVGV